MPSQAAAKEALYPTPTPVSSDTITGNADPAVPEFSAIAVLAIFLALSLFAVTMLTIRKRKTQ